MYVFRFLVPIGFLSILACTSESSQDAAPTGEAGSAAGGASGQQGLRDSGKQSGSGGAAGAQADGGAGTADTTGPKLDGHDSGAAAGGSTGGAAASEANAPDGRADGPSTDGSTSAGGSKGSGAAQGTGGVVASGWAGTGGGIAAGGSAGTGGGIAAGGWAGTGGSSAGSGGSTADAGTGSTIIRSTVDLLLAIDNSASMGDKQAVLATAVSALVNRFLEPACLDMVTRKVTGFSHQGACPAGTAIEFAPPENVHVGIIDSSLGAHGVQGLCQDSGGTTYNNDKSHLLTRGMADPPASGFLDWVVGGDGTMADSLSASVMGAGQSGCGYESQLESVYRFLVDPDPPDSVALGPDPISGAQVILATGRDETLLQQRAAFVRPSSLVVVILMSDENDCSLQEYGQAWLALAPGDSTQHTPLRPGTSVCRTNPNDPCCFNCSVSSPPTGCPSPTTDPACTSDGGAVYFETAEDPTNLRCWHQKERYGVDFLYDVHRYIDGFSQPTLTNRSGTVVNNPLFFANNCLGATCQPTRKTDSFLFTAIVGVPWQDLAHDPTDLSQGYKTPSELESTHVWPMILGDPHASPPVAPSDPLMRESVVPRAATTTSNPLGAVALPNRDLDASPTANPINGHEWDTSKSWPQANSDLQYVCTFPIPSPKDCSQATAFCDCSDYTNQRGPSPSDYKSPLCQTDAGTFGTTQYRAKAYPGLRQLEVVRGLGDRGLAASICPASMQGDPEGSGYGYNQVVNLLVARVRPLL